MLNIAVFVSGGGTNLQALIDAQNNNIIKSGKITLVVASNDKAFAIKRAENNNIKAVTVSKKSFSSQKEFETKLKEVLVQNNIDLIVLAGYLTILSANFTRDYEKRIINVHPSLIPSFCGEGFYGLKVHEEALKKGVKVTGATVHFVNEIPDDGEIILQKAVEVQKGDTAQVLQKRVMEQAEWNILPKAVELVCQDFQK